MFTTFAANPHHAERGQIGVSAEALTATSRPRRQQVSRACSWCRTYRIKCDDRFPCHNCLAKGRQCMEKGGKEVRTFSLALRLVLPIHAKQQPAYCHPEKSTDYSPGLRNLRSS